MVQSQTGKAIRKAFISTPVCFNLIQSQMLLDAAKIAGFEETSIYSSPGMIAVKYCLQHNDEKEIAILTFDFGGGFLDISVSVIESGIIDMKVKVGIMIGGIDFDNNLMSYMIQQFKNLHKKDLSDNQQAIHRLWSACERVKKTLSDNNQAHLDVESLFNGIDFKISITRDKFEELNVHIFKQCSEQLEEVLKLSKMSKSMINEVLLVGGSTRIPRGINLSQIFSIPTV